MSDNNLPGPQVQRACKMLEILTGHVVQGLSNRDLAEAMRTTPTNVTRTADGLIAIGWVEKDEVTGRFRITTRFGRLAFKVRDSFARERASLDELERNYMITR